METSLILYLFPVIAAFALYLLKRNIDQLDRALLEHKAKCELLQIEIQNIRNDYLHKSDFREFKTELREMFEELKSDIKAMRDKSA